MDNQYLDAWFSKLQNACQQIEQNYIDIIIDQCGVEFSVIPALKAFSPEIEWQSLYQGLPEDIYPEDAPLLVRVSINNAQQWHWLQALAREVYSSAPLLALCSSWPLPVLGDWFGKITDACCEGREGIFRFWDARIFPYFFRIFWILNNKRSL